MNGNIPMRIIIIGWFHRDGFSMDNVSIFYPANAHWQMLCLAGVAVSKSRAVKVMGGIFWVQDWWERCWSSRSFDVLERLRGGAMMHKFFNNLYIDHYIYLLRNKKFIQN